LVLALDAASPDVLRRGIDEGWLPSIAALEARGRSARTRSVEGLYVGATWPSFAMGLGPAHHGIYWLDRVLPGTYRMQRAGAAELVPYPTLWDRIAAAGRDVLVLDVPLTGMNAERRGVQVVEWGVHDAVFGYSASPGDWEEELRATYGPHPAPPHCDAVRSPADLEDFADQLERGAALRARWTKDLFDRHPEWGFTIQVFSETHCAGHQLWHTHDPEHPAWDPDGPDLVRRVYRAVDAAVGEIVDAVGPETTVALVDLHGMSSSGGHSLLLREILIRLGYETPEGSGDSAPDRSAAAASSSSSAPAPARGPRDWARSVYHTLLPGSLRDRIYEWRQSRNQSRGVGSPIDLDPARTRAFAVGLGTGPPFSAIRLNLRGREPGGILEPGAEADAFVDELRAEFAALVDPRTREPAVARVVRTRELFEGPRLDHLPDLLVEWVMHPPRGTTAAGGGAESVWEVESPRIGRVSAQNRYCRTGEHRPDGWMVLAGPAIEPGFVDRTLSILELPPTFGALVGVPTPGMEAQPAAELLDGVRSDGNAPPAPE
jgi:predicted AlkP superfamily phosphohydrolase/phosphomutase